MTVAGIDVAHYQPDHYPVSGLDFVFVKATEGTSYVNPSHDAQVAWARTHNLVVGHYHFQRPGSPTAQAAYFLAHAKPRAGDLLACDWEDPGVSNADKDAFIKAVQKARPGLRVGLYANRTYWTERDRTSFCGHFLWIADPSAPKGDPRVEHPWVFHQYSSAGGLDRNVANFKDAAALRAWASGTTEEGPMAGMSKTDICNATWKTDDILPAGSTEPNPKNRFWLGQTYLTQTFENTVQALAQARANGAALTALAAKDDAVALSDDQVQQLAGALATDQRFVTALSDALAANLAARLQS